MKINFHGILRKSIYFAGVFFLALLVFDLFTGGSETEPEKYKENFEHNYGIYALDIPVEIDFAGEQMPVDVDDVRERLDRELLVNTYWQSNTLLFFKRANRWFPVIEPILKKNGVPDDFKYLTLVESGLQNVVSPSGAASYWQFMKNSAKEYGLDVNSEVDERYDMVKATEAACKYFLKAREEFDNWTLAAASFNMGVSGLRWHLAHQDVTSFYDLNLNSETSRYIFRLLAIKEIMENPGKYGFHFQTRHLYQPYKIQSIVVDSTIDNLYDFAKGNSITYKELKILNPWLRSTRLTINKGKQYTLLIPEKNAKSVRKPVNIFFTKEIVKTEIKTADKPKKIRVVYEVKKKENIESIANKFGIMPEQIMEWNNLDDKKLRKGQSLKIYTEEK